MAGMIGPSEVSPECILQAVELAGNALLLSTATDKQLSAAAGFLAQALARFPDEASPLARKAEAAVRLECAGAAIGAELSRRAFVLPVTHPSGERDGRRQGDSGPR